MREVTQKGTAVFVSSTQGKDLIEERAVVIDEINQNQFFQAWAFEQRSPSTMGPVEFYTKHVKACRFFVIILGEKYSKDVEQEYRLAKDTNKRILAFIKDVPERDSQLAALISDIHSRVSDKFFKSTDELRQAVKQGLDNEYKNIPRYPPETLRPSETYVRPLQSMNQLLSWILNEKSENTSNMTAIWGIGGTGKTKLASALCNEEEVVRMYPDGIVSAVFDLNEDEKGKSFALRRAEGLSQKLRGLGKQLEVSDLDAYTDPVSCINHLNDFLASREVLVILDNVWSYDQIDVFIRYFRAENCHLLVTTRYEELANPFGPKVLHLKGLEEADAVELLRIESGRSDPLLTDIVRELDYHPLAIHLVGCRINATGMDPQEWLKEKRELSLSVLDNYEQRIAKHIIEPSVNELEVSQRDLYHSLGVFPEHRRLPLELVLAYWQQTSKEFDKNDLKKLIYKLQNKLGLIELDTVRETVNVHDLLHDYNKTQLQSQRGLLQAKHAQVLLALNPHEKPWHELEDKDYSNYDAYLCRLLPKHLVDAGKVTDLPNICDQMRKMVEHLEKPNQIREDLLFSLWTTWADDQEIGDEAVSYLHRDWLPAKITGSDEIPYTARTVAVRCAFQIDSRESEILALTHPDIRVRTSAMHHVHDISRREEDGFERSINILEGVRDKIDSSKLLLNIKALNCVIQMSILILEERFNKEANSEQRERVLNLLRSSLKKATHYPLIRFLGPVGRSLIIRLIAKWVQHEFKKAKVASVNNIDGLDRHFSQGNEKRIETRKLLSYLDRDHPFDESAQKHVLRLILGDGTVNEDRITGLIAEYIIALHGVVKGPDYVKSLIRQISDADDGSGSASQCATHIWSMIMERQSNDQLQSDYLDFMRDIVTNWLDNGQRPGYGINRLSNRSHQIYPLGYYTALWTRMHPETQVDLLTMYAERARNPEAKNEDLELHIVGTFGDMRHVFARYEIPLTILRGPIASLEEQKIGNEKLWDTLAESLGTLYSSPYRADVERLLQSSKAPEALTSHIRSYAYQKSTTGAYMRIYGMLLDLLLYQPRDSVVEWVNMLDSSLEQPSLGKWFANLANSIIRKLENNNSN